MAGSSPLTALQQALLAAVGSVDGAYLTGGSCLAHVYLHHRRSLNLDYFVAEAQQIGEVAERVLLVCESNGWQHQAIRTYPGFRRIEVHAAQESTLVDIAHDAVLQLVPIAQKPVVDGGVRVDALRDLIANKLTALLGRGDVKDLLDLCVLARRGHRLLDSLADAQSKDAGLDPATLAWVLQSVPTDPGRLDLLEPVTSTDLRHFRDAFVKELVEFALPDSSPPKP